MSVFAEHIQLLRDHGYSGDPELLLKVIKGGLVVRDRWCHSCSVWTHYFVFGAESWTKVENDHNHGDCDVEQFYSIDEIG